MKRIVLWFMSTLTVVTLLFGYHTSTSASGTPTSVLAQPSSDTAATSGTGDSSGSSSSAASTVTGPAADTRWGPVQVQLTVEDGTITDVTVVEYPTGNGKDRQINARAIPVLVQETLDAQSADIDMVSGATVTSEGYLESLQAALDEAGL
ncbi:FMN-binding protein [Blastococcus sp. TF02-09]|uniref:FMN-binding protein n=1 Tax=Blastococcus sp. TF02-09 TaxID=2250576 RepID=UPI000DE9C555|nr:FMN-binding protein [Blastococcus sp. TF02-9]RBY75363.1 FMN-binding protein [Blastococcus sp. TF02-9]